VNLLLDTHTLLWWLSDDPKLSTGTRQAIADASSVVYVSAVTLWEIAIKSTLGKLELPDDFDDVLATQEFWELPLNWEHARRSRDLPWIHRDPFDRMLIAQAQVEALTLASTDSQVRKYGVACC